MEDIGLDVRSRLILEQSLHFLQLFQHGVTIPDCLLYKLQEIFKGGKKSLFLQISLR